MGCLQGYEGGQEERRRGSWVICLGRYGLPRGDSVNLDLGIKGEEKEGTINGQLASPKESQFPLQSPQSPSQRLETDLPQLDQPPTHLKRRRRSHRRNIPDHSVKRSLLGPEQPRQQKRFLHQKTQKQIKPLNSQLLSQQRHNHRRQR